MKQRGSKMPPRLANHLRSSVSNLTWMLIDHRHRLPLDMGRPRPRLLLFVLNSLMREATTIVTPFKLLFLERKKPLAQPRLTQNRVRGQQVDISETTIYHMLFGPEFPAPKSTVDYDRRFGQTRDKILMRNYSRRASLMRWVVVQIAEQGPDLACVATSSEVFVKAFLSFPTKFWWVVVRLQI